LDRKETVALLKELVTFEEIQASWVSIVKKSDHHYRLQLKTDNCADIKVFAERRKLFTDIDILKRAFALFTNLDYCKVQTDK